MWETLSVTQPITRRQGGRISSKPSAPRESIILAPVVLALMVLVSVAGLAREAPLTEKVGSSLGLIVLGGMYFLLMKSVGQAIYILFDIAGNTRKVREAVEMSQEQGS